VKIILSTNFPDVISTNMLIGNDFFVFKYPFKCKQYFPNFFFIKIYVTVLLLCAQLLMTNITYSKI